MRYLIILLLAIITSGCQTTQKQAAIKIKFPELNQTAATKGKLPTEARQEQRSDIKRGDHSRFTNNGSLWKDDADFLFADHRARKVGDIVTVIITESSSASKEASTSTERESNMKAGINSLFGLEGKAASISKLLNAADLVDAGYSNNFEGKGKTSRKENLVATITAEVVGINKNGNLVIEGDKIVTVNFEDQIITLQGVVRPQDIRPGNQIDSKHILNARISYKGDGVISDKQRPGWLVRILDNIWPF